MKKLLLIFITLAISVYLGVTLFQQHGFLLVAYQQWTVQMPLWFAALCLLLGFLMFYVLMRLLHHLLSVTGYIYQWRLQYRRKKSRAQTERGLIDLAEGKWRTAERYLSKAAVNSEKPLVNYLALARAAQAQGDSARRDAYLQQAKAALPDSSLAVALTQAEFQMANEQYQQALNILEPLYTEHPAHDYLKQLLLNAYIKCGHWQQAKNLLPILKRRQSLGEAKWQALNLQVHIGLLDEISGDGKLFDLYACWQSFTKAMRQNSQLIAHYAAHLMRRQDVDTAEALLRRGLKQQWDQRLVRLYGLCETKMLKKQLDTAETWLQQHAENALLLLTLGRLCLYNQLWGKARAYFESSLALEPNPEIYRELAQLLDQLGEHAAAAKLYRQGLLLVKNTE